MPRIPPRNEARKDRQRRLGARLSDAIKSRGMSMSEVTRHFDRSHTWLQHIIKGKNGIDALDLQDLADFLEYPINWFTDSRWDVRKPHWPRTEGEWLLLSGYDVERARAHYELDRELQENQRDIPIDA